VRGALALALLLAGAGRVWACSAGAEQVLVWDPGADLAVTARWSERDRVPPPGTRPDALDLRRISTGQRVALDDCTEPGASCDPAAAFARVAPGARWHPPIAGGGRVLRVRRSVSARRQEWALETRDARGWQRLAWLDFIDTGSARRRYQIAALERTGEEVVVAVQFYSSGDDCSRTVVQALRFRARDLQEPRRPDRQQYLLGAVRQDAALPHWRTVAELGPLPADRLLDVLEIAEGAGHWAWGAHWWREATAALSAGEVAALAAELRRRRGLDLTARALGFPARE
jgi:hypothetical protein